MRDTLLPARARRSLLAATYLERDTLQPSHMSIPNQFLRCTSCTFEAVVRRRPVTIVYELADGSSVKSGRLYGWCAECQGVRDIESRLEVEILRQQLEVDTKRRAGLKSRVARFGNRLFGGKDSEGVEFEQMILRLRLAESRKSPPRCLTCGSTSVHQLGTVVLPHSCGGELKLHEADDDSPRFSYRPEVIRLNAEGYRVG